MPATTLSKWGTGAGVHVSKSVMNDAGVKLGDTCAVTVERPGVILLDFTTTAHRPVLCEHVTFDDLFGNWNGKREDASDPWAGMPPAGAEKEMWG